MIDWNRIPREAESDDKRRLRQLLFTEAVILSFVVGFIVGYYCTH